MREMRDAVGDALVALGKENGKVVVLDADLSKSTRTAKFGEVFPDRFFNMGIAEQDMICTAAGLALAGFIPFASSFALFAMGRPWEQVRNTVSRSNLNVKIVATHSGVSPYGDGPSHEAFEDIACARVLPNFRVIVPANYEEAFAAITWAASVQGPVYVRLVKNGYPAFSEPFKAGVANVLRQGSDVTLVACGPMVHRALAAAEVLAGKGVDAEVINCSTIKPLDENTVVGSARKTGCVVTCEEHNIIGGLGGAVCELLSENYAVPVVRVGVRDRFGSSARNEEDVVKLLHLGIDDIVSAALKVVESKK